MRKTRKSCIWSLLALALADASERAHADFPPNEKFDAVAAPALPPGWSTNASGATAGWATVADFHAFSPPNTAFANETGSVTDTSLVTPPFFVALNGRVSFLQALELESNSLDGFDGVVLEISISSGPFDDILHAGGSFANCGYDHLTAPFHSNPLAGRPTWSGSVAGASVVVNLPPSANGHSVQLRWRMGTDNFFGGGGYWLDNVHVDVSASLSDAIFAGGFDKMAQCI